MVKVCGIMGHFLKELSERLCLPHKAASWIFDGVHHTTVVAQFAQLSSDLVQTICCRNFRFVNRMDICQSIWVQIGSENRRVISSFSTNESCSTGGSTWWCKMHVYTSFFFDYILHELETFWFQKV